MVFAIMIRISKHHNSDTAFMQLLHIFCKLAQYCYFQQFTVNMVGNISILQQQKNEKIAI